jgi:hypothetical protein
MRGTLSLNSTPMTVLTTLLTTLLRLTQMRLPVRVLQMVCDCDQLQTRTPQTVSDCG